MKRPLRVLKFYCWDVGKLECFKFCFSLTKLNNVRRCDISGEENYIYKGWFLLPKVCFFCIVWGYNFTGFLFLILYLLHIKLDNLCSLCIWKWNDYLQGCLLTSLGLVALTQNDFLSSRGINATSLRGEVVQPGPGMV